MSSSTSNASEVFDVRRIRRLVELMNEHGLNEIDLRQGDTRLRLRRGIEFGEAQVVRSPAVGPTAAPAPPPATAPDAGSPPTSEAIRDSIHTVTSPMVGTFYRASSPDQPPFINVGDLVSPESTIGVVEAMKVFNEIPSGVGGKVVAILVENEEPVEFGQPICRVDANA